MLISRLALSLFWFPGVCPLRLEYFHIPQKDYGFLFLFSLFNFQGPVRSVFFPSAWLFYHTFRCLSRTFFSEVFIESFSILSHRFRFVKNFFSQLFAELFYLTTTTQGLSRFFSAPLSAWLFYHAFSLLSTPFSSFFRLFSRFGNFILFSPQFLHIVRHT